MMNDRRNAMLMTLIFAVCGTVSGAEPPSPSAGPLAAGLRFVHIGNSHSNTFRLLDPLAKAAGHPEHKDDEIFILGAPLWWNWDHPEQNEWKEKLGPGKPWDAMLLLCWNSWTGNDRDLRDTAMTPMFAGEAYKANPQCQVLLYTIWLDANQDMDKPPEVRSETWTEKVAEAVAKAYPNSPRPKVIPSSLLIREIGRLADRGEIPGMKTRFEVYSDGGHLSDIGRYAVLVMACTMLYDESPLDYPDQIVRYDAAGKPQTGVFTSIFLAPETSRALRRIVWDILRTYPPAGMKPRLAIGDRWLPPAAARATVVAKRDALRQPRRGRPIPDHGAGGGFASGRLKEPFWTMDQPVAVTVHGKPVKQATFSAVWEEEERQKGKAQNLWLAVKVLDGTAGESKKDGVHLYIDGRHNREVIYNSDDTQVFLPRDGWPRSLRGKPEWFFQPKVTEIEGGYVMEIRVGSTYFIGEGNPIDFGAKSVYGFDLAVEEEAGRKAWRGNEKLDENTSVFGTIVLTDERTGSE
jgi:hypothetical protein